MNKYHMTTFFALTLGLIAQAAAAPPTAVQEQAPGPAKVLEAPKPPAPTAAAGQKVLKVKQLTDQQYDALPDSQLIEIKGKPVTKGALRARIKKVRKDADGEEPPSLRVYCRSLLRCCRTSDICCVWYMEDC